MSGEWGIGGLVVEVASEKKKEERQDCEGKVLIRFGFGFGRGSCMEDGWMDGWMDG